MLHWLMAALMLACIHALAALWHRFIRKDATLMRMLPIKR
ncbi:cytochrome b561 [Bosea sp. OK403]|nr:cytochrome b561 [Bosea sp. OK403]